MLVNRESEYLLLNASSISSTHTRTPPILSKHTSSLLSVDFDKTTHNTVYCTTTVRCYYCILYYYCALLLVYTVLIVIIMCTS